VRVRDRDAAAGPGEHRHVVRHVAEGEDVGLLDAELLASANAFVTPAPEISTSFAPE
jgi:hypothetical protein